VQISNLLYCRGENMKLTKSYKFVKIIGLLSFLIVVVGTILIFAQQKEVSSKKQDQANKKPMESLENTGIFYRTSTTEVDTDEGNNIVAVRKLNVIVDATDSEGNLIKRKIPMVEIELSISVSPPISNLMSIVRIGDKEVLPANRACATNSKCVSVELYQKEFEQLPDNALITYRIGFPIPSKTLKEVYKTGEPKEVVGAKFGRLDKSMIDKFPSVERNAVQN
jgi:hypothetical protein